MTRATGGHTMCILPLVAPNPVWWPCVVTIASQPTTSNTSNSIRYACLEFLHEQSTHVLMALVLLTSVVLLTSGAWQ